MAKQARQSLNDGKSKTEAKTAFTRGIVDLMVFVENYPKIVLRDANASVPNLDAQLPAAATAAKQYLAAPGVFQRVRE